MLSELVQLVDFRPGVHANTSLLKLPGLSDILLIIDHRREYFLAYRSSDYNTRVNVSSAEAYMRV